MKSKPKQLSNYSFQAIGTYWSVITHAPLPDEVVAAIDQTVEEFDSIYSRFRSDSLVRQMSEHAGSYTFPQSSSYLFDFYEQLYIATDGQMTPLIGDLLVDAGYDDSYSFSPGSLRDVAVLEDAIDRKGAALTIHQPVTLDLGAAGKGYLIDIIGALLESNNIADYIVDGSGDMRHQGDIENRVGLEHPGNTSQVIGVIDVSNKSLAASATNRRQWKGMHHVLNPHTKKPVENVVATWVIADEAMVADGLATALFFVNPDRLKNFSFQYVRMHSDGSLDYSPELGGQLF